MTDLGWRQVALFILRVEIEHVADVLFRRPVINEPNPTSFPATFGCPTQLAKPATPADQYALFGPQDERELERPLLLVGEMLANQRGEHRRLNEAHGVMYAIGVLPAIVGCGCLTPKLSDKVSSRQARTCALARHLSRH